jgi:DNA-binding NarL/FixJ family response regulator
MDRRGVIVVIDPDEQTRAAARAVAALGGCDVVAFDDGTTMKDIAAARLLLAVVEVELAGDRSGLELLGWLHDHFGTELPVILVSRTRNAPADRVAGLLLGADDYVLKPFDSDEFRARMHRSLRRSRPPEATVGGHTEDLQLSGRERQILCLLAAGQNQADIAAQLFISPKTVGTHIQHLLTKLNVRSRAEAVAAAYRIGIAAPGDHLSSS